ncbi:hypothetical protein Fmac_010918 [Flemingia macrophylla]|uniref:Aminotransferase-like plant mobile domain-containing protein n=1 Tax=Flemingia macrophylla TaxID=520843 RepID=A0ABD1MKZ5_9FABA
MALRSICGPLEGDLLVLQSKHVSTHVWNEVEERDIRVRHARPSHGEFPRRLTQLLQKCGFGWIIQLEKIKISKRLVLALIERWRSETHTFHMPFGECTITLQDIAVLTGLPVDGRPLIPTIDNPKEYVNECLGDVPSGANLRGLELNLGWLQDTFANPDPNVDDLFYWQRYARAWIMRYIGGVLFPDKSASTVNLRWLYYLRDFDAINSYAWGAAVLGYLYRNLCVATDYDVKNFSGYSLLLQLWVWERFPKLMPVDIPPVPVGVPIGLRWTVGTKNKLPIPDDVRSIRHVFDTMTRQDIIWQAYNPDVLTQLPEICRQGEGIWQSVCPLISFMTYEWHQPDRVMRQFGWQQSIPHPPMQPAEIHFMTCRGKDPVEWQTILCPVIEAWTRRQTTCFLQTEPQVGLLSSNSEYMRWFKKKGLPRVDPCSDPQHVMADISEQIAYMTMPEMGNTYSYQQINNLALQQLTISQQADRCTEALEIAPEAGDRPQLLEINVPRSSREAQHATSRRRTANPIEHTYEAPPKRQTGMNSTPT